jgi:hypothetical protein
MPTTALQRIYSMTLANSRDDAKNATETQSYSVFDCCRDKVLQDVDARAGLLSQIGLILRRRSCPLMRERISGALRCDARERAADGQTGVPKQGKRKPFLLSALCAACFRG